MKIFNVKSLAILSIIAIFLMLFIPACSDKKTKPPEPTATVHINLTTSDAGSVSGAIIKLENHNGVNTYQRTATDSTISFAEVVYGEYTIIITHSGYHNYAHSSLSVYSNIINHPVELILEDIEDPPPTSLLVKPENVTLDISQTQQLTITVTPANANPSVTWLSSNTFIATVSSSGEVTALAQGQATITATSALAPDITATRVINVNAIPTATVIISLTTNDGGSVVGANVVLQNHSGGSYQQTATSKNVILTNVAYSTYSVIIAHAGYFAYTYESLSVQSHTVSHSALLATNAVQIGDIITFGAYEWRVLDIQDGMALLISQNVLERRVYHTPNVIITWENCSLRSYLNGDFYNAFNASDRNRIVQVTNQNPNNPTYGTPGGNPTQDRIFLLSISEAQGYFSSNSDRIATYNWIASWWWLRSPGLNSIGASSVNNDGRIYLGGGNVSYENGGVRPALWLNL